MPMTHRGYTLIELIIAIGLFSVVMTLTSGAYFVMIGINRQTQNITAGINDLSFALESMTRSIRTGVVYACEGSGDCENGGDSFHFKDSFGNDIVYSLDLDTHEIKKKVGIAQPIPLTDSHAVKIDSLVFYVFGTSKTDNAQPYVNIVISGAITPDPKKPSEIERFTVETGAAMRGIDL